MSNGNNVAVGALVYLDKAAFDTAAIPSDIDSSRCGVILNVFNAREILNIDTDDTMCEVMLDTGERELFYTQDISVLNETEKNSCS